MLLLEKKKKEKADTKAPTPVLPHHPRYPEQEALWNLVRTLVHITGRLGIISDPTPGTGRMPVVLRDKHARLFTGAELWLRVKDHAQGHDGRVVADTAADDADDDDDTAAAAAAALIDSAKLAAAEAPWNPMFRKLATT